MKKRQDKLSRSESDNNIVEIKTLLTRRIWDDIEQFAKIISLVAIPLMIAVVGWLIQDAITKRSVNQQYVQMAISILTKSETEVDPVIRDWAVDLLNENAPAKLSPETIAQLKSGQISLFSKDLAPFLNQGTALAMSPDGKYLFTGEEDGTVHMWDFQGVYELTRFRGHSNYITSIAVSPDGKYFASGSGDNTARIWDISKEETIVEITQQSSVIGVVFSPDGKYLLTRSQDGIVSTWDSKTGAQISMIRLK